jgi:hypothetical protein
MNAKAIETGRWNHPSSVLPQELIDLAIHDLPDILLTGLFAGSGVLVLYVLS